jgi:hypothetical protein
VQSVLALTPPVIIIDAPRTGGMDAVSRAQQEHLAEVTMIRRRTGLAAKGRSPLRTALSTLGCSTQSFSRKMRNLWLVGVDAKAAR